MPQCPICNAAIWVDQQYCSTCLSPLLHPEEEVYFCPQCGTRMATPEDTCQRCKVAMPEIALMAAGVPARVWRLPLKVPGIFMGTVLIIVGLYLGFPFKKSPAPPQLIMTPASQAVSGQTPTAAPIPATDTVPVTPTVAAVQETTVPSTSETPSLSIKTTPVSTPAPSPPVVSTSTASPPRYFVNNDGLSIREAPDTSAPLIGALNHKDEVELLDTSGGWGKVRDVRRNVVGWAFMRYLQPLAVDGPRAVSQQQPADSKEPESLASKKSGDM